MDAVLNEDVGGDGVDEGVVVEIVRLDAAVTGIYESAATTSCF